MTDIHIFLVEARKVNVYHISVFAFLDIGLHKLVLAAVKALAEEVLLKIPSEEVIKKVLTENAG